MNCKKCVHCIKTDKCSYNVNCKILGKRAWEASYCKYYMTKRQLKKIIIKKVEDKLNGR